MARPFQVGEGRLSNRTHVFSGPYQGRRKGGVGQHTPFLGQILYISFFKC